MSNTLLHYIYDPLCGWCYGAAPLVEAARSIVTVRLQGGGMLTGANRRRVTSQFRSLVTPNDRRIAQISGQKFGEGYIGGLLQDSSVVLDSEPPISAVLAADQIGSKGLDMLARLQAAHYVEGQRISDRAVLLHAAAELGIEARTFEKTLAQVQGEATQSHISESRGLLERLGSQSFPTFALEADGRLSVIDISTHLGHRLQWQAWLRTQVSDPAPSPVDSKSFCSVADCLEQTSSQFAFKSEESNE